MSSFEFEEFFYRLILSLLLIFSYFFLSKFVKRNIDKFFIIGQKKIVKRIKTVRFFTQSIFDSVVLISILLIIFSIWGFNITPFLTGAGIFGLAITFGGQNLIKDLISGFFILWENQFNVGDRVKIGNFEGEVYKMTMRMTVLRDDKENLIYIPNSQINSVVKLKKRT